MSKRPRKSLRAGEFSLRESRPGDEAEVQRIVSTVMAEYGLAPGRAGTDADVSDIAANFAERGGAFRIVMDSDGRIVGCGGLYALADGEAEIRKMYLLPPARGRGLGHYLLNDLLDAAARLGFRRVVLETASVLKEAIGLYRSAGFVQVERAQVSSRCDQYFSLDLEARGGASSAPLH